MEAHRVKLPASRCCSRFLRLRLSTPHMTRCMCCGFTKEKILPETGTLLRPRLSRLVHRTLATVKITDQTRERTFRCCELKS